MRGDLFEWGDMAWHNAIRTGKKAVVEFLLTEKCPWDREATLPEFAATFKQWEIYDFLVERVGGAVPKAASRPRPKAELLNTDCFRRTRAFTRRAVEPERERERAAPAAGRATSAAGRATPATPSRQK
jgi:hypothetical protein